MLLVRLSPPSDQTQDTDQIQYSCIGGQID